MNVPRVPPRAVAVIGSGVAGLTAAYVLSRSCKVVLYEADNRIGGHAHTHLVEQGDGSSVAVDSAFLVHNDRTYPTLCRLFQELGVATQETDMSMSVRAERSGFEYAGSRGVRGLFPSLGAVQPRHIMMLAEVAKFHRAAAQLLRSGPDEEEPLGEFLARHSFSRRFTDYFMTPLVAAVWSCDPRDALRYPARFLFVFLEHHGMLSVFGSPTWRTVTGGSARYVERIAARLSEVRTNAPVRSVRRVAGGVSVQAAAEPPRHFDAAVIAAHSDQALAMLAEPTADERRILGKMAYSTNHAQLHTDASLLPKHRFARASWNYLIPAAAHGSEGVLVTYDISRLMRVRGADGRRFLVSLGAERRVAPESVIAEMTYHHPLYTPEFVAAQRSLPTLGDDRVVFAGAYHGWGFHEDGAASGLRAAQRLGADWKTAEAGREELAQC
ncbi:amine oxidase [Segniliparus rotundus DSM 44985]|uniref:Amine oxidase n=1 Tax=Segniliparus rotundus (strain ATCC BAA-972 / CDC 1076 / CIP 108378 / DSM 44985 / JCM 13578) TaxID=640132 RepID=D6Z9I3_SEGRD|nr:FAD-dependent oxidoreductase [Segniliparus rotundus]ADG96510.1 amine oxidase [Segniliparus rotundus DSM 44985]